MVVQSAPELFEVVIGDAVMPPARWPEAVTYLANEFSHRRYLENYAPRNVVIRAFLHGRGQQTRELTGAEEHDLLRYAVDQLVSAST